MKEKTETVLYLNIAVLVLIAGLAIRTRQMREAFQMMGIPGTATPVVKCVGADGTSQCRFVDTAASTKDTLVLREQTTSTPLYTGCGKTSDAKQMSWNGGNLSCDPPADSVDKTPIKLDATGLAKVTCPKADETFFVSTGKCATVIGTLPRCIPDSATVASAEVKAAMPCYANRYSDTTAVSKLGGDINLLWNDWSTLGVYNLRNPCCDAASAPAPPGTFKLGDTVIEKDWKFWTIVGLGVTVLLILMMMIVR